MFKESVVKVVNVFVVKKYMYEVHMYVCTYIHTYVLRTYVHTCTSYFVHCIEIQDGKLERHTSSYHSYFVHSRDRTYKLVQCTGMYVLCTYVLRTSYICTYIHSFIPNTYHLPYVHTYPICTYVHMYIHTTHICTYVRT